MFKTVTGVGSIQWRSLQERRSLRLAFGASVMVHCLGLVAWIMLATAMLTLNQALLRDLDVARQQALARQIPTVFVEVNPELASPEPPPDTPFYSTANTRAANPDPVVDTATPRIDGEQEKVLRTRDVLQPSPEPLQPSPPAETQPVDPGPESTAQKESATPSTSGDLAVATATERPARPRTLTEARISRGLAGPKADQKGGVRRPGSISIDAKWSPFGAYDAALIAAIQQRWYDLIEENALALRGGSVTIHFTLHSDGRVNNVEIADNQVGEIQALYCSKAIRDPSPYARWPEAMRHELGRDYREVRITFHYF
jgi:hypothetical protein